MKIVYFGLVGLGSTCLKKLIENNFKVELVITEEDFEDKLTGSSKNYFYYSYKEYCEYNYISDICSKNGIELIKTNDVNKLEIFEKINRICPDVIIVSSFHRIIPAAILNLAEKISINVHPSFLPYYRGGNPQIWQILNGEKHSGVTIHKLAEKIDAGDILCQKKIDIKEKETGGSLYLRIINETAPDLLISVLESIKNNDYELTEQKDSYSSYFKPYTYEDSFIDWNKPAVYIERQVRAGIPHYPAYFVFDNKTISVWESNVIGKNYFNKKPGEIIFIDATGIVIQTSKNCIKLIKLQLVEVTSEIFSAVELIERINDL